MWTSGLPVPPLAPQVSSVFFITGSLLPNLTPLPTTEQPRPFLLTVPGLGHQPLCGRALSCHTLLSLQLRVLPVRSAPGSPQRQQPVARPHLDLFNPAGQAADPGAQILLLQAPRVGQDFCHERGHRHEAYPHQQDKSLQRRAPQLASRRRPHRTACRETEFYRVRGSRTV